MPCKVSSVEKASLFAFQLAKVNRSSLSVSHTAMTFYTVANLSKASRTVPYRTAVVLSDIGRFGNGERRADDGESCTGLDTLHYSFRGSEESGCR